MTVTKHARIRLKQRLGISEEEARRVAKDIVKRGHVVSKSKSGALTYHYNGLMAVIEGSTILTAYPYVNGYKG